LGQNLPQPLSPESGSSFIVESKPATTISDGQTLSTVSPRVSVLTDSVSFLPPSGTTRSYWIHLTTNSPLPSFALTLQTFPIAEWGLPLQLPGGADSLPPLSMWTWHVLHGELNDTNAWSATNWNQALSLTTTWSNQSYEVIGSTSPVISVSVNPNATDGSITPGVGFVMNYPGVTGAIPTSDPDYSPLAAGLHPEVVRFGTDIARVSAPWNTATNQPKFNFTYFDQLVNFTHGLGAKILLSLPAGSWGDGNLLPNGMPLNLSVRVVGTDGRIGFFPTDGAWKAWVEGVVNHSFVTHANITYWTIGNEFPTTNQTLVAGYTHVFNLAQAAIHAKLPGALVGSDVMMNLTYEGYFGSHARGVGFLSFHTYPGQGLCVSDGALCPPTSPPDGSSESDIFSTHVYQYPGKTAAPAAGQRAWHNLTGKWLPVLNAETNLNGIGGNAGSQSIGTDPRIQNLFGASWVVSALIDGARQNVSELTYFTLSSAANLSGSITYPYGGWGFGLTAEGSADSDVLYAPYLALQLWGTAIPAGRPAQWTSSSAPSVLYAYAAANGTGFNVVLVSRVNVQVTAHIVVGGGSYVMTSTSVLDQRSYQETFEPGPEKTVLRNDSVHSSTVTGSVPITIDGYGVAVARFSHAVGRGIHQVVQPGVRSVGTTSSTLFRHVVNGFANGYPNAAGCRTSGVGVGDFSTSSCLLASRDSSGAFSARAVREARVPRR